MPTGWHKLHPPLRAQKKSARRRQHCKSSSGAPFPLACPRATTLWWRASPTHNRCHHPPFSIWLQKEDKSETEQELGVVIFDETRAKGRAFQDRLWVGWGVGEERCGLTGAVALEAGFDFCRCGPDTGTLVPRFGPVRRGVTFGWSIRRQGNQKACVGTGGKALAPARACQMCVPHHPR